MTRFSRTLSSSLLAGHGDVRRALLLGLACCLLGAAGCGRQPPGPGAPPAGGDFAQLMNTGKNYYDKGEAQKAIEPFRKAVELNPTATEAQLNLANAYLLAGQADSALRHAQQAIEMDHDSAAAHYVAGCAYLRLGQAEPALQALQTSKDIEPKVGATTFQLGRAHMELGHYADAAEAFRELIGFEPEHPSAHFLLGQSLVRLGRQDEANQVLETHRQIVAQRPPGAMDPTKLERCVHTEAQAPFVVELPNAPGIPVRFAEVTSQVLENASAYRGPLAVIDCNNDGRNSLFAREAAGFQLLVNSNGVFRPRGNPLPAPAGAQYSRCLVADLEGNRFDDVIVVGDQGCLAYRFATNAMITDSSAFARLREVQGADGVLVDLDFTGKLDLLVTDPTSGTVRVMRNLGNFYFKENTATSGIPATLTGIRQLAIEDWNNDDLLDVIAASADRPPELFLKQRGGPLAAADSPTNWPAGPVIAVGDVNNDLRGDLWIAAPDQLVCSLNGLTETSRIHFPGATVRQLLPLDYDNDGWLDLLVAGDGLRVFRNLGPAGFRETTSALGLEALGKPAIDSLAAADFDVDGDTDLALGIAGGGIKILRNDGGNANLQLKVRLFGNRSNPSGIGTRVEIHSGGLRIGRRVATLPVEIGVGQHRQLESLSARWLNLSLNEVDAQIDPRSTRTLMELVMPEGSCPYLFAWDGQRFRFVTDILGSSPLGLRATADWFVEADPEEYVWLGGPDQLRPRDGSYVFQVTEELREVLYLDAAQLVAVDHPVGTEVFPTGKMVPKRPFPPHGIVTLHQPHPLRRAVRSDGLDVTESLQRADGRMASPVVLRIPQLRGLAEPWHLTLDFGPLPVERPLVLAMTAWLRFGGGMANVGAAHNPELPFPFPTLEVETAPDQWRTVDLVFGVPSGKTKNFVVDLTGQLPPGSGRLRIQTAYELHWDRIALMEKAGDDATRITRRGPDCADLHYRGYGDFEDWPWYLPLTPSYERVTPNPAWHITPMGWCTRYGDVLELVDRRDNALVLLNGGDEVTLRFAADALPPVPDGCVRGFFFYSAGWDKDSDFHCEKGWLVEPLPWHGLDDQQYGRQARPVIDGDWWIRKYNTRWVGLRTVRRG